MANAQIQNIISPQGLFCASEADTRRAGQLIASAASAPVFLSLEGPMGAGKTCFVKGLAEGLGCDPRDVSSPTFTLVHEYRDGRLPLVHMDLYRIEAPEELAALGFDDCLTGDSVVAVEWGGKFREMLPPGTLRLAFSIEGNGRRIVIQP